MLWKHEPQASVFSAVKSYEYECLYIYFYKRKNIQFLFKNNL